MGCHFILVPFEFNIHYYISQVVKGTPISDLNELRSSVSAFFWGGFHLGMDPSNNYFQTRPVSHMIKRQVFPTTIGE